MEWDKLRTFYIVAEAGSFTHASERLNLSQSAISRQVQGLEESMGFPLFHRHPRGLILTEQGETLLKTVTDVFVKLERICGTLWNSTRPSRLTCCCRIPRSISPCANQMWPSASMRHTRLT